MTEIENVIESQNTIFNDKIENLITEAPEEPAPGEQEPEQEAPEPEHKIDIEPEQQNPDNLVIVQLTNEIKDQDFSQRINVTISVAAELYRLLSSSLLILFVPQECDGHVCSLSENMVCDTPFYYVAISFNYFTLFSFLLLYTTEIIRENRMIKYLDVNANLPTDDKSVEENIQLLPVEKKNKILSVDKYYQVVGYHCIITYVINVIFSSIIVNDYYLNNQTTTAMITYILLMVTKLSSIYTIAHTDKNVFYSAYLKTNVQYNDVDNDFKEKTDI